MIILIVVIILVVAGIGVYIAMQPAKLPVASPATGTLITKDKTGLATCYGDPKGYYLKTHPDVARAGVDPFLHWCHHGKKEGRSACFTDPCPTNIDPNSTSFMVSGAPDSKGMSMSPSGGGGEPGEPGEPGGPSEAQMMGNMRTTSNAATDAAAKRDADSREAQRKAREQAIKDMQDPNKGFMLCAQSNGWCVESQGAASPGHAIAAYPNQSGRDRNKLWYMIVRPDGWYTFRNVHSQMDLETGGGDSQGRLRAYRNDNHANKAWKWDDDAKTLCNKHTGGCIYPNTANHEVGVRPKSQTDDSFKWNIGFA